MSPKFRYITLESFGKKILPLFVALMLAGQAAVFAQSTYTSTSLPAVLAADGYTRHTASLGTTTATAMTITYDNGSTIKVPATPTTSNMKMLVSGSSTDFSAAAFIQADTVNTLAKTVTFHPPAGKFYTLAISAAADMAVVTNGPASAVPGATISYKLEVTNTGPSDVQNVIVKMPNLSNFTVTTITATGIQFSQSLTLTSVPATYTATTADLKATGLTIPAIAAFGSVGIIVTGTAGSTGTVVDASAALTLPPGFTDINTANNTNTFSTAIFTPEVLSRYYFNRAATISSFGAGADIALPAVPSGDVSFNLVYTLKAGDPPIAPFGDTVKIPATVSAMANKANGAVNKWSKVSLYNPIVTFLSPYVDDGHVTASPPAYGVNLLENLPYKNYRSVTPGRMVDSLIWITTNSGYYAPLGTFNYTLGALPTPANPLVSLVTAIIKSRAACNSEADVTTWRAYTFHNLGTTSIYSGGAANTIIDTIRPNATYPVVYFAFTDTTHNFNTSLIMNDSRGYFIDSGMVVFSGPVSLPLHLLSFDAQKEHNSVQLNWTAADEKDIRSFDIERSANGKDFTCIGAVAAINGESNHSYAFTDAEPSNGANIYRLHMVDNSNTDTYSSARYLEFTAATAITVAPNPARDVLYIRNAPSGSVVSIVNMEGQLVQQQELASSGEAVDIARCSPGTYIVQIKQNGKVMATERLIKQ